MRLQKTQVANPKTVLGEHAEFRYNISWHSATTGLW
jgi:hypothetical protein